MSSDNAIGVRVRRNGQVYYPRSIEGMEDLWFYRNCQKLFQHVLLAGPPGSGKTAGCEAAFDSWAEDEPVDVEAPTGLYTLIGSDSITADDFVGSWIQNPDTGNFEWVHGPLTKSIIEDKPFLIDEIALIDPKVLSIMYPLMDGRGVLEVTQNPSLPPFRIGKGWFVIGAYNPDVPGAYLSEALLDRFDHRIEVETDWDLAIQINVLPQIVRAAKSLNLLRQRGTLSWSPQFRSLLSFKTNEKNYGIDYAVKNLISKTPFDDRDALINSLAEFNVGNVNSYTALKVGDRYYEPNEDDSDFG